MLARTRLEWVLMDFALAQIGAVPAPIYPSSTAAECCYILEHSNVVGCFAEDDELLAKIEGARPQHVYTVETLPELRALGREHAAANPDALERAREQIDDDDLFTFIYTSGTTGPPKGCLILNRNYYDMVGVIDEIADFFLPTDVMLLYLPLAHNFGRLMHLFGAHLGYTVAFLPDPRRIGDVMPEVRPTVLPTVPRVLEKVHTAVSANFAAATGVKRRLIDWALAVGKEVSELRQRQEPVPAGLAAQAPPGRPARLLEGQGATRRTAARRDLRRRSAAEGDRRVLPRARHPHPRGIRPDRGDDGLERESPEPLQVRHRGAADPGHRGRNRRGRRDPDQGARPSSPATTRTSKRRAQSCPETDGCTPATSARSTRTASSRSPTARRTSSSPPAARTSLRRTSRGSSRESRGSRRRSSSAIAGPISSPCSRSTRTKWASSTAARTPSARRRGGRAHQRRPRPLRAGPPLRDPPARLLA